MNELDVQTKKEILTALKLLQSPDEEAVLLASSIFQIHLECIDYNTYITLFIDKWILEYTSTAEMQKRSQEICANRYSAYIRRHLIDNYQFYVTVDKDNNFIIYEDYLHKTRYR